MTGRDLIIHILKNGLEDEPVFKDGKLIGFFTAEEAATRFGAGIATIRAYAILKQAETITIGNDLYIPANIFEDIFGG